MGEVVVTWKFSAVAIVAEPRPSARRSANAFTQVAVVRSFFPSAFRSAKTNPYPFNTMRNLFIVIILLSVSTQAFAQLIKKGDKLIDAQSSLTKGKYSKTVLQMSSTKTEIGLEFWVVDQGVLIITYSKVTGIVEDLTFTVSDGGPRSTRKEFDFSVVSFDTLTGHLTLSTKKKK